MSAIINANNHSVIDVGTAPTSQREWETTEIRFHNFTIPAAMGSLFSPTFTCCGYSWRIQICPNFNNFLSVRLYNLSNEGFEIIWCLCVRNAAGKEVAQMDSEDSDGTPPARRRFEAWGEADDMIDADSWGARDFAKRSTILYALEDGTLTIDVRMKRVTPVARAPTPTEPSFIPSNPLGKNILKKFNHEESADLVFEVVGDGMQEGGSENKRAKTSSTNFNAHRFILQDVSSTLAELCKASTSSSGDTGGYVMATVQITDVKPDIFKHMLYYIYGGKISEEDLETNAKDIIDACDRYGVVSLKLEAEACYVKSTTITVDNMMDNLLYADSKNCALLKEAVIDFAVQNGQDVLKNVSLKDVPGGVFADLLTAMTREKKKDASAANNNDSTGDDDKEEEVALHIMRVTELRKKLDEKGLDVDGSREAMIATLKGEEESS